MRRACWILIAVGCGHAAKPAEAPRVEPERPAATVADIAGTWVSTEDLDWHMTIDAGGTIDVWVDRDKAGRCEQKGTLAPGATVGKFRVVYTVGGCSPKIVNKPIEATITATKGMRLTIVVGTERRTYEQAARMSDDDSDKPAGLTK